MSMFLAVLMVFGCFSAWPTQVSAAESDYEIYPKPHLMEYQVVITLFIKILILYMKMVLMNILKLE